MQLTFDAERGWHINERISMADKEERAMSMEEFGPVSVDYFTQHRVESVRKSQKKDGPEWIIKFEGGGEIHNFEPEVPLPKAIVGAALTRTIMDGKKRVTRLQFGLEEVTLNPMKYAIKDSNYTKGKLVYPQTSMANIPPPPPDEPEGRAADGPSEEWKESEADRLASEAEEQE